MNCSRLLQAKLLPAAAAAAAASASSSTSSSCRRLISSSSSLSSSSGSRWLREPPQTPNVLHGTRLATDPRWRRRQRQDLYERRLLAGPERLRARSEWSNWSREAELYALTHRLRIGDQIELEQLDRVFLHSTEAETEEAADADAAAAVDAVDAVDDSNTRLQRVGRQRIQLMSEMYLQHQLPHLPRPLRQQVADSVCGVANLATVAGHLGLKDLIVSIEELPYSLQTLAGSLCALIGCVGECLGEAAAWALVRDFCLTSGLLRQDVNELYQLPQPPDELLRQLLRLAANCDSLEFRLLRRSAQSSPAYSCFRVGAFANRRLLAAAFGETQQEAMLDAAGEALKLLFGTQDDRPPFDFSLTWEQVSAAAAAAPPSNDEIDALLMRQ